MISHLSCYLSDIPAGILQAGNYQVTRLNFFRLEIWADNLWEMALNIYLPHGAVDNYGVVMNKLVAEKIIRSKYKD